MNHLSIRSACSVSPTPSIMRKRLKVESIQAGLSEPSNPNIPVTPPIGLNSGTLESANQGLMLQRGHGNATPYEKVQNILERHGRSFCDELGVDLEHGGDNALWQWFCAAVLLSARIKSTAGLAACQALFHHGVQSPSQMKVLGKEECQKILRDSGYDRYDNKIASFLMEDASALLAKYDGKLNNLREMAGSMPAQERALLKKFRGVGDGGTDIFFREVQLIWTELFPFADKKALKAARLVGLREHPQALAELCGNDKRKYVKLIAALVRIEVTKSFAEF